MNFYLLAPVLWTFMAAELVGCAAIQHVQAQYDVPQSMVLARYAPEIVPDRAFPGDADRAIIVVGVRSFPWPPSSHSEHTGTLYPDYAEISAGSLIFFKTEDNAFAIPGKRHVDAIRIAFHVPKDATPSDNVEYRTFVIKPGNYNLGYFALGAHWVENVGHFSKTATYKGLWDTPVGFSRDGGPASKTAFTVSPGETVYIGDFIFGDPRTSFMDGIVRIDNTCKQALHFLARTALQPTLSCHAMTVDQTYEGSIATVQFPEKGTVRMY